MPELKLTALSHGAGCACKLSPAELHPLLRELPVTSDPALLVGLETADDAAVYRVSDDLAIVTSVDFFTPIVDDPYDFGRIAAANALSDVYAMGGAPITALNLVAYSLDELGGDVLREILRGGAEIARDAGAAVVGGHSIDDREPKYGMAVTGVVHPDRVLRNSTAAAGHDLFLSKPVGGGVASTAMKRGLASDELTVSTVEVMTALNRDASQAALAAGASAATDVTGFGLLGHLHELTAASGVAASVDASSVPCIAGVLELLGNEGQERSGGAMGEEGRSGAGADGMGAEAPIAGGTRRNRTWVEEWVEWGDSVPESRRWLLCDAMTSGGLLVAVPPGSAGPGSPLGARIGRLVEGEAGRIRVE